MCECGTCKYIYPCGKKPEEYIIFKSSFYFLQTWFLTDLGARWEAANSRDPHIPFFCFSKC